MRRVITALAVPVLALFVSLSLASPRRAHAGACARPSAFVVLLTPSALSVPAGEGVLVGIATGFGGAERSLGLAGTAGDAAEGGAAAFDIGIHLERGDQRIVLRAELLAPSLARLVPERAPEAGAWEIVGSSGARVAITFGPARVLPALRAPTATELRSVTRSFEGALGRGGGSSTSLLLELGTVPPASAVAIIASIDAGGTLRPQLFHALDSRGRSQTLIATGGRCSREPPGHMIPAQGSRVSVAWVDGLGRVSPASAVLEVR